MTTNDLFTEILEYPDPATQDRYLKLVGLDDIKQRLVSEAVLLLDKDVISKWSEKHHGQILRAADELNSRAPLIILAGDVGVGKTELAETFLDQVARQLHADGTLYELSLAARGKGAVGEMTTLLGMAFKTIIDETPIARGGVKKISVLLVDEGDSLAQSRENTQMHHEDRTGVNALIKGIDNIRRKNIPALVILCTNRLGSIDPAVKRRAAYIAILNRPNEEQRMKLFTELFSNTSISQSELDTIATKTGEDEADNRKYGYTYSDIRQRLIPDAVMLAVSRDVPLTSSIILESIQRVKPTRPFEEKSNYEQ
jgi:SpoVK/Ycf46/Vps4 family AAA+-type ATPase